PAYRARAAAVQARRGRRSHGRGRVDAASRGGKAGRAARHPRRPHDRPPGGRTRGLSTPRRLAAKYGRREIARSGTIWGYDSAVENETAQPQSYIASIDHALRLLLMLKV